jgi:hypothetical protein
MSRSSAPKTNTPTYAHNGNGYLPFVNLATQRLSKLLIDGSISARDFRMEVLRYLIYPKTLMHYPIHQQGWLAVLDKKTLDSMRASGHLKALNDSIKRLEADSSLTAYERVGKITAAIKEATGKQFIRNSAFRQLMHAKFNEYTLSDRLDDIHGIDDALRIMEDAAVQSKPMKMISAFPELFAASSVRRILENDVDGTFIFGGSTDSVLPEALTTVLRRLTPERLRTGAFKREVDDLLLGMVDEESPTYDALKAVSDSLPSSESSVETKKLAQYLQFSIENKMDLAGVFQKPGFLDAAEMLLKDEAVTEESFKALLKHHVNKEYDSPPNRSVPREPVDMTVELLDIAGKIVSAIKDVPVKHMNSYDTFLLSLSDTYSGKSEKSRHPFVWAMDALLAVDSTQPNRSFQRECAKTLHGIPVSLFPTRPDPRCVTQSLQGKVEGIAADRFDLYTIENGHITGSFMTENTFIHGAPTIDHFRLYRKQDEPSPVTGTFDDDIEIVTPYSATVPLRLDELRFIPSTLNYMELRQRAQIFGSNPKTMPPSFKPRRLQFARKDSGLLAGKPFKVDELLGKVLTEDANTTLGVAFNIETKHTQLHKVIEQAADNPDKLPSDRLTALIAAACQHGASVQAVDGLGNSLIHDVIAKGQRMEASTMIEVVTTLIMHGGHFAGKNHFGVSLLDMLPDSVDDKLRPLAMSSVTSHEVSAVFDDLIKQPAVTDPLEQQLEKDLLAGPVAPRRNSDVAL